jgi:hypothetical protein
MSQWRTDPGPHHRENKAWTLFRLGQWAMLKPRISKNLYSDEEIEWHGKLPSVL